MAGGVHFLGGEDLFAAETHSNRRRTVDHEFMASETTGGSGRTVIAAFYTRWFLGGSFEPDCS
jgi:hypothetical protein